MLKFFSVSVLVFLGLTMAIYSEEQAVDVIESVEVTSVTDPVELKNVYVIPIEGPIGKPTLFILRRGLKDAISNGVDVVVIDMNTPGGELGVTLEIMKMLDRFEGDTITFVNNEAISAGAFISVITDKIFFRPDGQIGAAEVVSGTGQEIAEGMKRKLQSYINAKVRVYTEDYRYRGDIMRAMTDPDFELTIEGKEFSKKGDLLSLTAKEAIQEYGDPPERLLGEGIAETIEALLDVTYGVDGYHIQEFEVTWSEELAKTMQGIVPILMGLGVLLLFIEFKTPSFGVIGGIGIALIILVFASNYVAGLAGYEVILVFFLGVVLVAVELFVLPGTTIFAFLGVTLMMVSMIWSLADIWPSPEGGLEISWDAVIDASKTVILSMFGALLALVLLWRFLPTRFITNRLIHVDHSPSPSTASSGGAVHPEAISSLPPVGSKGKVITDLHPLGSVVIEGEYYEAQVEVGSFEKGEMIQVVGYKQFSLLVDKLSDLS